MYSIDYGEPRKSLKSMIRDCIEEIGPTTMSEILKKLKPPVGYVRDYRDRVLLETKISSHTPYGDPIRILT